MAKIINFLGTIAQILVILISIFIALMLFITGCDEDVKIDTKEDTIKLDTIYNVILIDSVKLNIKEKDSIIVNYKRKIVYEKDKAINANDSIAIKQFYSLSAE